MVHGIVGRTDSQFRAYMAKLVKLCKKKFIWTPLPKAEAIMRRHMHGINEVCAHLGLKSDFIGQNEHLQMVPYTETELKWAAKNGVVLTLHTSSVRRLALLSENGLEVSREIWQNCPDVASRGPRRASWYLALRQTGHNEEARILCRQPKTLRMRMRLADVGQATTAVYLDSAIYGIVPSELRMTESIVRNEFGVKRVLVGGAAQGKMTKIQVIAGQSFAQYPPMVVWKPHPVPHV